MRVTEKLIRWADWVFCMEKRHVQRLHERFGPGVFEGKRLVCLDIPDDYRWMDPELVAMLETALSEHLEMPGA